MTLASTYEVNFVLISLQFLFCLQVTAIRSRVSVFLWSLALLNDRFMCFSGVAKSMITERVDAAQEIMSPLGLSVVMFMGCTT